MDTYKTTLPTPPLPFGESLRAYRKAAKLSQAEAAKVLGVSPRQLWNIETGVARLPSSSEVLTQETAIERITKATQTEVSQA